MTGAVAAFVVGVFVAGALAVALPSDVRFWRLMVASALLCIAIDTAAVFVS